MIDPITKTLQLPTRVVMVRELTVGEIRGWLADVGNSQDLVDVDLLDGCCLRDLRVMTDLTDEEVSALTPSQLQAIVNAAKEVNGRFFTMREKIDSVLQSMISAAEKL